MDCRKQPAIEGAVSLPGGQELRRESSKRSINKAFILPGLLNQPGNSCHSGLVSLQGSALGLDVGGRHLVSVTVVLDFVAAHPAIYRARSVVCHVYGIQASLLT